MERFGSSTTHFEGGGDAGWAEETNSSRYERITLPFLRHIDAKARAVHRVSKGHVSQHCQGDPKGIQMRTPHVGAQAKSHLSFFIQSLRVTLGAVDVVSCCERGVL